MINFLDSIYYKIEDRYNILSKFKYYAILRLIVVGFVNLFTPLYYFFTKDNPKYSITEINSVNQSKSKIIVTLTTFPSRIDRVWLVVETILRQTVKPDLVVLWLSKEQFTSEKDLPSILLSQIKRGLEIRFVDEDLKSYKKYYFCLKKYPKDIIITIDDDIFYRSHMVEDLLKFHCKYDKSIIAHYANLMSYNGSELKPYVKWVRPSGFSRADNLFFGSGGGTLFPPNSLYKDVLEKKLFLRLAPHGDDIWLNAMCRLSGTKIVKTGYRSNHLPVKFISNFNLSSINNGHGHNDIQLNNVIKYYSEILNVNPFSFTDIPT